MKIKKLITIWCLLTSMSTPLAGNSLYHGSRAANAQPTIEAIQKKDGHTTNPAWEPSETGRPESLYFDTARLSDIKQVEQQLQKDGFELVHDLKSADGLKLHAFFRKKNDAVGTIISSAGFFPGDLCGMATYTKLFPENYNVLLFNARGHRNSDGNLFSSVWNYGFNEYKDILGAIQYLREQNYGDTIFLHGTCSGAYHALRTLCTAKNAENIASVRGVIADSAWSSIVDVVLQTPRRHLHHVMLVPAVARLFKIQKNTPRYTALQNNTLLHVCSGLCSWLVRLLLFPIELSMRAHEKYTTITDQRLKKIKIPVLYIHDQNDYLAEYAAAQNMFKNTPEAFFWDVGKSSHANHVLKCKYQYKQVAEEFFNYCNPQEQNTPDLDSQ